MKELVVLDNSGHYPEEYYIMTTEQKNALLALEKKHFYLDAAPRDAVEDILSACEKVRPLTRIIKYE